MDIESYLIEWINALALGVEAFPYKPDANRCITVERTGGSDDGFIDHPMVAIQCWGETFADAEKLARALNSRVMAELADGRKVTSCSCNSLARFPGEKDEPRYQLVYDIDAYRS